MTLYVFNGNLHKVCSHYPLLAFSKFDSKASRFYNIIINLLLSKSLNYCQSELKKVSSCFFYANAFLDSGKTRWSETGLVSGRHDRELVAAKL